MVTNHCKMIVKKELLKLGLHEIKVDLGEVEIMENISALQYQQIKIALLGLDLELLEDKKKVLVEKIKNVIVDMLHYSDEKLQISFSDYLCKKLHYDYTYLANLFSEEVGITIEKFIITHKIEKVKELIFLDELTITEIAWKLHYSSVAHLSNQFKKETGLTPTLFKKLKQKRILSLEEV